LNFGVKFKAWFRSLNVAGIGHIFGKARNVDKKVDIFQLQIKLYFGIGQVEQFEEDFGV
jgi:hypothetical protein